MKQKDIGWLLLGLLAVFLFLFLKKKTLAQTTSQVYTTSQPLPSIGSQPASTVVGGVWNSKTDKTMPSDAGIGGQPPFQNADGTLECAVGWSLWKDEATGISLCFKEPTSRKPTMGIGVEAASLGEGSDISTFLM